MENFEASGSVERRQGRGTKRKVSTRENTELVLSQESQLGTHRSVCEIARETDRCNHSHQVSVFLDTTLKIVIFSTKNSTINNSINFESFSDKKLSCCRETARHFMSLNILLIHSRSFEMTLLSRACVSPY